MNYCVTRVVANLAGVSLRQLHRWRSARLIAYPPAIRLKTARGKWLTLYYWTRYDALPVIAFAKAWRNRKRAGAKRMDPQVKAKRAGLRSEMRAAELLLNTARWFRSHGLSSSVYTAWMDAEKRLKAAGLLDAQSKLVEGAIENLERQLVELKTQYAPLPGRHSGFRIARSKQVVGEVAMPAAPAPTKNPPPTVASVKPPPTAQVLDAQRPVLRDDLWAQVLPATRWPVNRDDKRATLIREQLVRILGADSNLLRSRTEMALKIRNPRLPELLKGVYGFMELEDLIGRELRRQNAPRPEPTPIPKLPPRPAEHRGLADWHVTRILRASGMGMDENRRNPEAVLRELETIHTTTALNLYLNARGFI